MSKRRPTAAADEARAHARRVRGEVRARHFAEGGDLAAWRGVHRVQADQRREQDRKACRQRPQVED